MWKITQDESASAMVISRIERNIHERVAADKSERLTQTFGNVSKWTIENVGEIVSSISGKFSV